MRRSQACAKSNPDGLLALVLAGGSGTRLRGLTRERAKPAVPFASHLRIVDFTLSNCVNSGIARAALLTQYKPEPLIRHIHRLWQNARASRHERIEIWPAQRRAGCYLGTADAVHQNRDLIAALAPEHVLIVAGDHVYSMNYAPMLNQHVERGAAASVGCVEVPLSESESFGIVEADGDGRLRRFTEKPKHATPLPGSRHLALASMGIYLFNTEFLLEWLATDATSADSAHDFGRDVLPEMVETSRTYAHLFRDPDGTPGYWRDVGTIDSYWSTHRELLDPDTRLRLDDASWPIRGEGPLTPTHISVSANVNDAIIGAGCCVAGNVTGSVLAHGCRVDAQTTVVDSVLLPGASIGRRCRIERAIIDSGCHVPDGTEIGPEVSSERFDVSPNGVVLVTLDTMAMQPSTLNPAGA